MRLKSYLTGLIYLFAVLAYLSFLPSSVQAGCNSVYYGAPVHRWLCVYQSGGTPCYGYCSYVDNVCTCIPDPTATSVPDPTATPTPVCNSCYRAPNWITWDAATAECSQTIAQGGTCETIDVNGNGQCFAVCNYDTCNWACTTPLSDPCTDDCTNANAWSAWHCNTDNSETRYCTLDGCTEVAQARRPCTGPTVTPGGPTDPPSLPSSTPTPTCGPLGEPAPTPVVCSGSTATLNWAPGTNANFYALRVDAAYSSWNADCLDDLGHQGDYCIEHQNSSPFSFTVTPGVNYDAWIHSRCGDSWSAGVHWLFNCPIATPTPTPTLIPTPPIPYPTCGSYNSGNTPVTWVWSPTQASGLQVWDNTEEWWFNDWTNPSHTDSIPTGRTVSARTTYNFTTFSSVASITCPTPTPTPTVIPTLIPTPTLTPTPLPPPVITCIPTLSGINWSWNNIAGAISYWLQVWGDVWKVNDWGNTSPTFTTGTPGVAYYGRVAAGDETQTSPWSNTATCTVPALSIPTGVCGSFNITTATTPITWTWTNGTELQCKNYSFSNPGGTWWYNASATSPLTILETQPGTQVCARTTYDYGTFSNEGCITCPMPVNQQTVISGVLRQKSGTGCYQADPSNNFNITNLSGSTGDSCVTIAEPCTFSIDKQHAISYSCTVTWDNQACVALGRQPDTTQTLTINAAAAGVAPGQFSNASCDLNGANLPITAGVNNPNADITFSVVNESWIKLKQSSYWSFSSSKDNVIPAFVHPYDADDSGDNVFILPTRSEDQEAGSALGMNIGASASYSTIHDWHDENKDYSVTSAYSPTQYLEYVRSLKEYKTVTNLTDAVNGVNVIDGNQTISSNDFTAGKNFVLVVTGTVNINIDDFNKLNNSSIAIIADTINFCAGTDTPASGCTTEVKEAHGIFIANTINTGDTDGTADEGLKINGNMVALSAFTNSRVRSDSSKPTIFIINNPKMYMDLLPYLSKSIYDWKQLQ